MMRVLRSNCCFALPVVIAACCAGCNSEKVPGLGAVTGTITMDGKPVVDAMISFESTTPGKSAALGKTDANGNYELYYSRGHKGAPVGEHVVYISTYQSQSDENPQPKKETIPLKYNGKSELKEAVKRGKNTINFELKSGGEIVQPDE